MEGENILPAGSQGKFIVFEGLDGSGQSTQISFLEKYLRDKGEKFHTTSEPSGSLIGGLIRSVLAKQWTLSNTGIQLLYAADRAHHLESEVRPALEKGNHVISSRYYFSTFAFGSLENDVEWLEKINEKFPAPDITIYIKVSPEECI
ncbi:MAG: dTMP kinase, partial [Candidatus Moranbacteria bacterium]|nr:dTMP kinase [Candidatus Moranbacteria bacterium]